MEYQTIPHKPPQRPPSSALKHNSTGFASIGAQVATNSLRPTALQTGPQYSPHSTPLSTGLGTAARQNLLTSAKPMASGVEGNRAVVGNGTQERYGVPTVSAMKQSEDAKRNVGGSEAQGKEGETLGKPGETVAMIDVQAKLEAENKAKGEAKLSKEQQILPDRSVTVQQGETKAVKSFKDLIMTQGDTDGKTHQRKLKVLEDSTLKPAESAPKPTPKSTMDPLASVSLHHQDSNHSVPTPKTSNPSAPFTKRDPSDSLISQSTTETVTRPPSARKRPDFSSAGQATLSPNVEEQRAVGLRNFGNVCFMNAVIQCLFFTPGIQAALQGELNPAAKTGGQLVKSVKELMASMKQGRQVVLSVMNVKGVISTVAAQFRDYEQHDAQEFLRFLLDALHEELNRGRKPAQVQKMARTLEATQKVENLAQIWWEESLSRDSSGLIDLFQGQLVNILTCSHCSNSTYTFEVFLDLSLPIPVTGRGRYATAGCSLQQCFEEFTGEKELEGVKCKRCGPQVCRGKMLVQRFPRILVLHLKRFAMAQHSEGKINAAVTCPSAKLDLSRYALGTGSGRYDLYASVHHMGDIDYGHYYAYFSYRECCYLDSRKWFTLDDIRVSSLIKPAESSRTAYILFYVQT